MSDQVTAGQVVAAIEAGAVIAHVRESVAVNRLAARKVKVYNPATGEVTRQADTADVMTALLAAEKLRADEREVVDRQKAEAAWAAVRERRAKGLPDLCGECGTALGMSPQSVRARSAKPLPAFICRACTMRKRMSSLTPEERAEIRERFLRASPDQRRFVEKKAKSRSLDVPLAANERKALIGRIAIQRSEAARKANAARTPEQRRESLRRAWESRRAKKQEST